MKYRKNPTNKKASFILICKETNNTKKKETIIEFILFSKENLKIERYGSPLYNRIRRGGKG